MAAAAELTDEATAAEAKRQRKEAAAAEAAAAKKRVEDNEKRVEDNEKRRREARRGREGQGAAAAEVSAAKKRLEDNDRRVEAAAEERRQRKAMKRGAAEAPAAEEVEAEAAAEAKRQRTAASRTAAEAAAPEGSETEGAAAAAAAAAKKLRKAAKLAAAEALAQADNGADEASIQEAPKKKQRTEAEDPKPHIAAVSIGVGKGQGKGRSEFEVFVAGLPATTQQAAEKEAKELFADCGQILTLKIIRGKAFIEFGCREACDMALKLHETIHCGKRLIVQMASDKAAKTTDKWRKDNEVFVAGLPFSVAEDGVRQLFAECGEIVALRMPPASGGKHRGIAFVCFTCKEARDRALELHGTTCAGRSIIIHKSGDTSAKKGDSKGKGEVGQVKGSKEFEMLLGGLPFEVTEEILRKDFEECGKLVSLRIVRDPEGMCKGIAFLEFLDKASCEKALAFDGTEYGGRTLRVRMSGDKVEGKGKGDSKAKGKGKGNKGKSSKGNKDLEIMLSGLPFASTVEVLKKDFGECGEIARLVMPLTDDGACKGVAYIEYCDKDACVKALEYNETNYAGRSIRVRMSGDRGGDGKGKDKEKGKGGTGPDALVDVPKNKIVFDSDED